MNGIVYPYGSSNLIETGNHYRTLENGTTMSTPGDNEIQATTLIQFSGGVDSTYVLWKWLVDNPDEYCLVHHIKLINYQQRHDFELEAVDKILRWLDNKGLKNYFYVQNTFDYGNFSSVIPDSEICGFHAGILLRLPRWKSINKVILPIYDNAPLSLLWHNNRLKIMEIASKRSVPLFSPEKGCYSVQNRYEVIHPLVGLLKTDVIRAIPRELLNLCWYCRTPLNNKICGKCHACREVEKSLEKVDNDLLLNFITQSESKNKKD